MSITAEHLNSVNRCQIAEMEKVGERLDLNQPASCEAFATQVRNVQAAVIHTYQITAFASLREPDPAMAAALWKSVMDFCEHALRALRGLKVAYPFCGARELYDLTLDYRSEAEKRYHQNLQDSECQKTPPPPALFPQMT
jgi:hypothetical protein